VFSIIFAVFYIFKQFYRRLQLNTIIEKTSVYHTVNGNRALFHTSKAAKMIQVILQYSEHLVRMSTCCLVYIYIYI